MDHPMFLVQFDPSEPFKPPDYPAMYVTKEHAIPMVRKYQSVPGGCVLFSSVEQFQTYCLAQKSRSAPVRSPTTLQAMMA